MKVGSLEIDLLANIARLQADMSAAQQMVGNSMSNIERSVKSAQNVLASLGVGVSLVALTHQVVKITDEYIKFTSQLKLASRSNAEYMQSYDDVKRIAHEAQASIGAVGVLYARIATSTRDMGLAQSQVADITETVNLALKVSGATASEAASATLQLAQAFGSGKLAGDEFKAVNESAPRLMRALADGMGVPIGALKDMAANGLITSQVMAEVLPKALQGLREESKNVENISGSVTNLKNQLGLMVGELMSTTNGVGILTDAINLLADNLEIVIGVAATLTASRTAGWLATQAQMYYQTAAAAMADASAKARLTAATLAEADATYATASANHAGLVALKAEEIARVASTTAALNNARAQLSVASSTVVETEAKIASGFASGSLSSALLAETQARAAVAVATKQNAVALTGLGQVTSAVTAAEARLASATAAHTAAQQANNVAQSQANVIRTAGLGLVSALGGPIGLITIALMAGVFAWQQWGGSKDDAVSNLTKVTTDLSAFRLELEKLNAIQRQKLVIELQDDLPEQLALRSKSLEGMLKFATYAQAKGYTDVYNKYKESVNELISAEGVIENFDTRLRDLNDEFLRATGGNEFAQEGLRNYALEALDAAKQADMLSQKLNFLKQNFDRAGDAAASAGSKMSNMTDMAAVEKLLSRYGDEDEKAAIRLKAFVAEMDSANVNDAQRARLLANFHASENAKLSNKSRSPGARQESQFAKDLADIQAQKMELDMLISLREKYGMQAESLTSGEKKIYELEAQLGLKQADRHGKLSDAQIQQLIREQGLLSEQQKAYDLLTKQKQLEADIEKFRQSKSDGVSESLIDLENESAMLFMSADARKVLSAQIEQEAEVRKLIAEQKRNGARVDYALESQLIAEAKARGQVVGAIEAQKIALTGARELYEANEKFAIDFILDEDKRNRLLLEQEANVHRARIAALSDNLELQKKYQTEFDAWYRNRQIAPEVERVKKAIESFESDFHTAFLDITTGGDTKNAWKTFTKSLGASLKTQLAQALYETFVKKYIVNAAVNMVGGDLSTVLGGGGSAGGGASNLVGSLFNAGSNMASIGSIGTGVASVGSMLGSTALTSFGSYFSVGSSMGLGTALTSAGELATAGMTASSAGMALGAAMPWIAGAMIAYSVLQNSFKGETRSGGTWKTDDDMKAQFIHGPSGGAGDKSATATAINATVESINSILKGVGSEAYVSDFHGAWESSKKGRGGVLAGGSLSTGVIFGEDLSGSNYKGSYYESTSSQSVSVEEAIANFTLDLKQSTIQALQLVTDIPKSLGKMVEGVDAESLTTEAVDALLEAINTQMSGVTALKEAMKSLPFVNIKDLSYDAAAGLIEFSGGIESLMKNLDSYYQKYYTDAERTGALGDQLKRSFYELNLVMPTSKAQFRSIVESIDVTTESGQKLYAQMMGLSGAFADYQDAFQQGIDNAINAVQQAYDRETASIRNAISAHQQFIKSIDDLIYSLKMGNLSPLSPEQKYLQGKSELDALIAKAEGGDENARQQIPDMIQRFLELSQGYNASSQQYQDDFAHYVAEAERLRGLASSQLDIASSQLSRLDAMVSGILDVNNSVMSLSEALLNYKQVSSQAQAANSSFGVSRAAIESFYYNELGRAPDKAGLDFWIAHAANNPSLTESSFLSVMRQSAIANGELKVAGSHFYGLDYVPYDGYIAELHKGERVLTANENQALSQPVATSYSGSLIAELRGLRADNAALRSDNSKLEARLASIEENQRAQITQQSAIAQKDTREREEIADASRGRAVTAL